MNGECYGSLRAGLAEISAPGAEQVFVRSQSVVSRTVAGETLIVPVRGRVGDLASIYSFNETGSLIWNALEKPTALCEIVDAMAQEFQVTREQAECDAVRFVNEMSSVGLVEVREIEHRTERPVGREG